MATILKIKRSSTNPTATPGGLGQGELAYGEGTSTYTDAQGASVTSHGKLFVGKGTETNGIAAGLDIIGGKYFTDLLDHGHGTVTANSAAIVDSAKKVDEWNVDNITLNGNTISTTNSNGDLTIDTNGTGNVVLAGAATVGTNLFKINDGSTDRFVVDSFSGAVDISSPTLSAADTLINVSTTWNNASATFYGIDLDVTNTASASTSRLLNLSVGGSDKFNINLDGAISMHGGITFVNETTFGIKDNTSDAFVVQEGSNHYIDIDTTDNSELLTLGNDLATVNVAVEDGKASAFAVREGTSEYIAVDTTNGSELITFGTGNVDIDNDLNIDGGDLTTNQTTFNLLNTTATTVNFAGAATTLVIGNASGNFNVDATGNTDLGGDLNVDGNDLTTSQTTFNLVNTTATTVNFAGAATTLEIGAASGTTNINNNLDVDGDVSIDGGDLDGTTAAFNLLATPTTVNFATAGTTIEIGAATGTTNINNNLDVDGDVNIDGGDLTVSTTTFNLANTTATTLNIGGAATTLELGAATGTTSVNNNLDVDGDVNVDGGDLTTNQTTFNVINTNATTVNAFGAATTLNLGTANTLLDLGNIRISGNTISTDSNAATELILDPFPDAGDAGGDVIIRGNLQVAGTTTTVNSTEMSVNDPVFTIGDTVSEKTVTTAASSGATDILVDNPSGIVEGATVTGTGIASNTTISNVRIEFNVSGTPFSTAPSGGDDIYFYDGTSFSLIGTYVSKTADTVTIDLASNISTRGDDFYNGNNLTSASSGSPSTAVSASITKVDTKVFKTTTLTISNATTTSVAAETKLTISQASDDNLDRGIQFKYLTSNTSKVGFFGYDDDTAYFTFIPDATNNSNLFSGTKGEAWFKTVKLDDGVNLGVPYFDSNLELNSTVAAGTSDATTSNQILTVNGSGVPLWTTTIDGGTY